MYNLEQNAGATLALASAGLAIGSTTSQYSTANAVPFLLNGRFFSRAAIATQALTIVPGTGIVPSAPNALQPLAIGQGCSFLVVVDAASALFVVQSPLGEAGKKQAVAAVPSGYTPIGVIKVEAVTAAYTPGTTALNAAGVTTTYFNVGSHPGVSL